ncbi:hypothetical protein [Pseudoflavonifractor sp. 524-17]|uniref:hypothetical protein n=1 Tax=Pseudoflavonifractor sp. 524-17 TaxID=2304577 RepID=UPI001FABFE4E|nr:hypothetical protein [Pseudoflavonifractor sp. 524-17]
MENLLYLGSEWVLLLADIPEEKDLTTKAENAAALPLKAVWIKPVEGLSGGDMVRTVIGEAGGLSSAG